MFVSASFEPATVETLVRAQRNLYESESQNIKLLSGRSRWNGLSLPASRIQDFKEDLNSKMNTNKIKLMINQLTWTQCGQNKQRCFREPFDCYPQNASPNDLQKAVAFLQKKTTSFLSRRSPHAVVHIQDSPFSILDSLQNSGKMSVSSVSY